MLRWTLYILRRLANLLGDPVDTTLCQVCEGSLPLFRQSPRNPPLLMLGSSSKKQNYCTFTGLSKLDELTSPVTKATTLDYPFPSPTTPTTCNSTHLFATVCKSDKVSYLVDSTRPSGVLTEFGFYVRDVEVAGSNPVAPTFYKPCRIKNL